MKYQVSIIGDIEDQTAVQLKYIDAEGIDDAQKKAQEYAKEILERQTNLDDVDMLRVVYYFYDKDQAVADGLPASFIRDVWNNGKLYAYTYYHRGY